MEFNDNYPQYEMMAHHDEEHGKVIRKKLWRVFWIMLGITLLELYVGFNQDSWGVTGTFGMKLFFIGFTILKAFFIVYAFMHLGDENRLMKWLIIGPYAGFIIYLVLMCVLGEGNYAHTHKSMIDPIIRMQHSEGHHEGGGEEQGGGEHKGGEEHHKF